MQRPASASCVFEIGNNKTCFDQTNLILLFKDWKRLVVFYFKNWRKFYKLHHFRGVWKIIYNVETVLSTKGGSIFTAKGFLRSAHILLNYSINKRHEKFNCTGQCQPVVHLRLTITKTCFDQTFFHSSKIETSWLFFTSKTWANPTKKFVANLLILFCKLDTFIAMQKSVYKIEKV